MMLAADPIRYGMIGGGEGAFIGDIHRTAAALTGRWRLRAGALSSDPERSLRSAAALGITPDRAYRSVEEMLAREQTLAPEDRIEVAVIVTPNHLHASAATAALDAGFDVLCDKPLADTLENAEAVAAAARRTGRKLGVTYTYSGYPMVMQARALIGSGELGEVRRVMAQYTQDWLSRSEDAQASPQAAWRTDPARAGEGGAFGDIGAHAFHLIEFVCNRSVLELSADLSSLPGRRLDDDGSALLRLEGGCRGVLTASQVCSGDLNNLSISVYCDKAGLHWRQEEPNTLRLAWRERPEELWKAGTDRPYLARPIRAAQRTPGGHPEGYLEAFANIYAAFADDVRGVAPEGARYPGIEAALSGMRFIRAAVESNRRGAAWVSLDGRREGST